MYVASKTATKERNCLGKYISPLSISSRTSIKTATTATSSILEDDLFNGEESFANISSDWDSFDTPNDHGGEAEFSVVSNHEERLREAEEEAQRAEKGSNSRLTRKNLIEAAVDVALYPQWKKTKFKECHENIVYETEDDVISVSSEISEDSLSLENIVCDAVHQSFPDMSFEDIDWKEVDEEIHKIDIEGNKEKEEGEDHGMSCDDDRDKIQNSQEEGEKDTSRKEDSVKEDKHLPQTRELDVSSVKSNALSVQKRHNGAKYFANHKEVLKERRDSALRKSQIFASLEKYSIQ